MFRINQNTKRISITRGNAGVIVFTPKDADGVTDYLFQEGDVIRFKVFKERKSEDVVIVKDVIPEVGASTVKIPLDAEDTKIGDLINSYMDYWYEIELNPDTYPQTLVGYDVDDNNNEHPAIFRLLVEGGDE